MSNVLTSFSARDAIGSTALLAGYAAARPTPTTKVGGRMGTNSNSTYAALQRVGMGFTAEMVTKDNPIASAYLGHRQNYCSSAMTYIPGTSDPGFDREIKYYLHGYDGFGGAFASMGVDCSMQDAFMRTADLETPVRGDAGLIVWRESECEPVRLIEFSADQLGELWQITNSRTCGLERDRCGKLHEVAGGDCVYLGGRYFRGADCVAYKIYERTNAWYANPIIYDACDIIYFRDPASFRGVRGVTFFANALAHMQKAEDLLQSAISSAQRQARTYGRVFNESGQSEDLSYETSSTGNITFFEKLPGAPLEEYYYTGDSAEFVSPNTPSPEIISGIETADERVALALRVNYAFLISATKVGGAPGRLEVEKADKEFQRIQNTIHRPRLRRIADIVLMDAMRRGELRPPRGMTGEQFRRGRWMLPISPSVDAFYDVEENIKMARAGFEAPQDIIAETNRNADDVLLKTKQWAVACSKMRQDANKELIAAGYKGDITAADIAQNSDNPQQAQAAESMAQGGAEKPVEAKLAQLELVGAVARLAAPHDVSDEKRADDGKWTTGGGGSSAKEHREHADKLSADADDDKTAESHKEAAQAHKNAAKKSRTEGGSEEKFWADYHEEKSDAHARKAIQLGKQNPGKENRNWNAGRSTKEMVQHHGGDTSPSTAARIAGLIDRQTNIHGNREQALYQIGHELIAGKHGGDSETGHANLELQALGKKLIQGESANKEEQVKPAAASLAEWDESKHKRGQPGNAGEFGPGGGSSSKAKETESGKAPAAKTDKDKTGRSDHFDMKADMAAQSKWMLEKAKADGHKDLDEVVANHSEKFGKWSSEWRRLNPRTKPPECDERCQRAKQAHVFVGSEIQRYAEEHNEPKFAKAIGGLSFDDNEPIDVVMSDGTGKIRHGIELKTIVKNSNSKITMKGEAMRRKSSWERRNKAAIHTVVIDDSLVFNANGPGKHDESKRVIYYRRGYGSFRINTMHKITGGIEELKSLIATDPRKLPDAAKTYKGTGQSKA